MTINGPLVMGILNLTPDSFYDGGTYKNNDAILKAVEIMLHDGASIIDIGGQSTRPNAALISEEVELERTLTAIQKIHTYFPEAILSIDTFRSVVAESAIQEGVSIINDISAGTEDERIYEVASKYSCPIVLMHRQGSFDTMHQDIFYKDLMVEVLDYFFKKINHLKTVGVKDIIVDPGFGFSKSIEQNYHLLKHLEVFAQLEKPILVGLSRKSMLYKLLDISPSKALNATSLAHLIALQQGASILRVHDVREAMECIKIFEQFENV